jgi:UDP-glucuronate decarboxylase
MALDDGRVVSNFVSQALTGTPITVYGDGSQTRSFQYVSDLIAGLAAVMDGNNKGPFNIGNPGEFTMLELANVRASLRTQTRKACIARHCRLSSLAHPARVCV